MARALTIATMFSCVWPIDLFSDLNSFLGPTFRGPIQWLRIQLMSWFRTQGMKHSLTALTSSFMDFYLYKIPNLNKVAIIDEGCFWEYCSYHKITAYNVATKFCLRLLSNSNFSIKTNRASTNMLKSKQLMLGKSNIKSSCRMTKSSCRMTESVYG